LKHFLPDNARQNAAAIADELTQNVDDLIVRVAPERR
jgi:hypothetical protein